jgi:hypothetical protein
MELHDRIMVDIRTERLELDELWSFVGKKQKNVKRHEINAKGDQYVFIGMAGTQKAIISWGVGKRNTKAAPVSPKEKTRRITLPRLFPRPLPDLTGAEELLR